MRMMVVLKMAAALRVPPVFVRGLVDGLKEAARGEDAPDALGSLQGCDGARGVRG